MRTFNLNILFAILVSVIYVGSFSDLARAELDMIQLAQTKSKDEFFTVALGEDYAFWSHYDDGIYVWSTSNPINAGQKISDDKEVTVLSASGNKLAWIDDSDDIQVWDGTSIHEKEDDVVDTISIYQDNIAFVEKDSENFLHKDTEIFLRIPGEKIQITDNDYDDKQPSLYKQTLAWVGEHDGDNFDLFYWDGQKEYKLTDTDGDDLEPSLHNGAIAWTENDGDDFEIFYWNGSGANIQITDNDDEDRAPVLRNGRIVWIKKSSSCQDIYMWNGSVIERLTDRCFDKIYSLDFNGKAILWSAKEDDEKAVYYAELPNMTHPFSGWWYNPEKPGTGFATEIKGDKIFLTWFVYDQLGRSTWYSAGGTVSKDSFTGSLYSWKGWPWGQPYAPPTPEIVGTIVVILNEFPAQSITFTATIGNIVVTETLKPFMADFAPGPEDPRHLTGWWYDPAYDGMGFFMDASGGKMAMVWYNYRADGSARWWTSEGLFENGASTYSDILDGWENGQCPGCPYRLPNLIAGQGGSITITFTDDSHATCTVGDTVLHLQRFDF